MPIRLAVLISLLAGCASAGPALLVTSHNNPAVLAYDAITGSFLKVFASGGGLSGPTGLAIGPDRNLYVASSETNQILRFDGNSGAFLNVFASGTQLATPLSLAWGPDQNLYVASFGTGAILKYAMSGAFLGSFGQSASLNSPGGMVFDRNGSLYVCDTVHNRVVRFDPISGSMLSSFGAGASLKSPTGITVHPDGTLFVSSAGSNQVLHFNFIGDFFGVAASGPELVNPLGLTFGPDGNLYVSTLSNEVLRYDAATGRLLNRFVSAASGGLNLPIGLIYAPNIQVPPPAPTGPISILQISGGNQTTSVFREFADTLTVEVRSGGVPVANQPVLFAITTGMGALSSPVALTDTSGRASTRAAAGPITGPMAVTASLGGASTVFQLSVLAAPPVNLIGITVVSGDGQNALINTPFANVLTVRVTSGGVPVANQQVQFAIAAGGGILAPALVVSDANGLASTRVTAGVSPGLVTVTATAGQVSATFFLGVSVPSLNMRALGGDGQEGTVNTPFKDPLAVQVNSGDQPVAGQPVHFEIVSGGGIVLSPNVVTDGGGRALTFVVSGSSAGALSVRATAGTESVLFNLTVRSAPDANTPVIESSGLLHAARRTPVGLLNSEIALGGIFVIYGRNLGPSKLISGSAPYGIRLPDDESGTSVRLTHAAAKTAVDAYVISASAGQVVAIAPASVLAGDAVVTVSYQGRTSNSVKVTLATSNFGIFTKNELGSGPAVAMTIDSSGAYQPIGLSTPAQAGQTVALRGTGLGPVAAGENGSSTADFDVTNMAVLIGGVSVPAISGGRVADEPATDEIRFRIPNDGSVPDGCYVPVAVVAGDRLSNFATISKAAAGSAGPCDHPLNLSAQTLADLDDGGSITAGLFGISRVQVQSALGSGVFAARGGIFATFDANSLFLPGGVATMTVTDGACTVYQSIVTSGFQAVFPVPLGKGLNAGSSLALLSPNLGRDSLPRRGSGAYDRSSLLDQPLLTKEQQGTWTFSGQGGADVGAFNASVELPAPISWTNRDSIGDVDRGSDLNIAWDAGGEARFERVLVTGGILRPSPDDFFTSFSVQFSCSARFMAGSLTVPSLILRQLPASTDQDITFLAVANSAFDARPKMFAAKSTSARAIDVTGTTYVLGIGKAVRYR